MYITTAICTWNRSKLLRQTLEQMTRLERPDGVDWELLIINNNSTDDTEIVVKQFKNRLPIRHVFEPKQGLSHARNRAIEESKGEVIIWTDDDVLVDPKWLVEYVKGFKKYPEAAFFGGPIEPWFEVEPPSWIKKNMDIFNSAFACRNISRDEMIIKDTKHSPYGANMAISLRICQSIDFNPSLGRTANDMISGEETFFFKQLFSIGHKGIWLPRARVKHFVPKDRLRRCYLKSYFQGYGGTIVRMTSANIESQSYYFPPKWLIKKLCVKFVQWIVYVLICKADREKIWAQLHVNLGQLKAYRMRRLLPKSKNDQHYKNILII